MRLAKSGFLASFLLLGVCDSASSVVFHIDRQSDTTATITATGTLDGSLSSTSIFFLPGVFGDPPDANNNSVFVSSTMSIPAAPPLGALGPLQINVAFDCDICGSAPAIYFGNSSSLSFPVPFAAGATVTGSLVIELVAGTFAPVGTTGTAYWGDFANQTGTWVIEGAAVPLPASLPLFAGGLAVVGWLVRRRQVGAPGLR